MDSHQFVILVAILGSVLGVLGGVVGCYFSIKNTDGPRERGFVVRVALAGWL
jgi:hypothetical protein